MSMLTCNSFNGVCACSYLNEYAHLQVRVGGLCIWGWGPGAVHVRLAEVEGAVVLEGYDLFT